MYLHKGDNIERENNVFYCLCVVYSVMDIFCYRLFYRPPPRYFSKLVESILFSADYFAATLWLLLL